MSKRWRKGGLRPTPERTGDGRRRIRVGDYVSFQQWIGGRGYVWTYRVGTLLMTEEEFNRRYVVAGSVRGAA
ncbi:MAG: hypothetical protein AAGI08_00065 [Bacteroidota bacterium]